MGSLCNYCHAMHICCSLCSCAPRQSCLPVSLGTESSWRLSLTSITVLPQTRTRHVVDAWHTCTISKHVQQYRFTAIVCIHLYYIRISFVSYPYSPSPFCFLSVCTYIEWKECSVVCSCQWASAGSETPDWQVWSHFQCGWEEWCTYSI